ncbi:pogo transposable [Stemphylium lycopersici]|uniref:Pogo transposable n=1 Tax=Stemphylium lycopersici TaxID=183478 RepID=A0A364MSL5_STELY|nr:pogo transposable [Stemphylium lycopersici]
MDEKGFFIGRVTRSKRIFSKAPLAQNNRPTALQDGNREWITLVACVRASGEALPPALIYQGTAGIQSSWVDDVVAAEHEVFVGHSPTGWTNNELGLAWLEQVFQRHTKHVAGRSWRLLILDGHGSHITADFIDFCDSNRILIAIFPPHSTHSLQPLDVVLFSPLSRYYTSELDRSTQRSRGITRVTKQDFYSNFWPAWSSTMTPELILKSFPATGVWPMEADAVLKRFKNRPQERDSNSEISEHGDGDSWLQLRRVFDAAVTNKARNEAQQLSQSLHSLQVNNALLHDENSALQQSLNTKRKRNTKSTTLQLHHDNEYYGGAVFWSPKRLRDARAREAAKQHEAKQLQHQKTRDRDLKAAAAIYKKQQAETIKVARQQAAEERRKAKKARAAELATQRALKKQQRDAATSQKSHDTSNNSKRKASHKADQNPTKRRRGVAVASQADAGPAIASPPPKISLRGRQIKTPARFK